jgi:hypothetical protein
MKRKMTKLSARLIEDDAVKRFDETETETDSNVLTSTKQQQVRPND